MDGLPFFEFALDRTSCASLVTFSLADVAARSSLEHQGHIDALEQDSALLSEYNRWLMQASKKADCEDSWGAEPAPSRHRYRYRCR